MLMQVVQGPHFRENCQYYSMDLAPVLNEFIEMKGKDQYNGNSHSHHCFLLSAFRASSLGSFYRGPELSVTEDLTWLRRKGAFQVMGTSN